MYDNIQETCMSFFSENDPSLTIVNDNPLLTIVNINGNTIFFKNDRFFKSDCFIKNNRMKNGSKSFYKIIVFKKRSLLVF